MCCKVLYSQIKVTAHEGAAVQQQQHFATSHPQIIIQAGCCESCCFHLLGVAGCEHCCFGLTSLGQIPFETSGESLTELSRHTHFQDEAVQFRDRDSNSLILKSLPMD
jgi:hypothetical protein